jgi:spore coat protein CotH
VYVDHGDGPTYFGLYTIVEVVDDTVVDTWFTDDNGNLYKPEGTGASFASGSFTTAHFEKKSNEDAADWGDVRNLYDALHASDRSSSPAEWRARLEETLDVDGFIRWLAVNTVMQNWDTYGRMTHNYYLYGDPDAAGRLTWIPWDNNEALMQGKMGGALSLSLGEASSQWPLIRYVADDPEYRTRYVARVKETVDGVFDPAGMAARYQATRDLIQPFVTGADGEQSGYTFLRSPGDFDSAISTLISHANARYEAAQSFVAASGG